MSASFHTESADSPEVAWRKIEALVERTSRATKQAIEPADFYAELLDGAIEALAATGGAVWLAEGPQEFAIAVAHTYPAATDDTSAAARRRNVREVAATGESRSVAHTIAPAAANGAPANRDASLLLLCPVPVAGRCVAVIELVQPTEMTPAACASAMSVLEALAEAAADFHQAHELRALRIQQDELTKLDTFAAAVQRSLDLQTTAFTIANDGRTLVGCDRVWVISARRTACRVIAVSGCDEVDRGAESVRAMERLASTVVAMNEPIWYFDAATELPPAAESRLHEYLDKTHARQVAFVPLSMPEVEHSSHRAPPPFAVIAAESFRSSRPPEQFRRRLTAVCQRSTAALGHALVLRRIPGLSLARRLASARVLSRPGRAARWPWILSALLVAMMTPWFISADFTVAARGSLQPKMRRHVYAPRDAIVESVFVAQGDAVKPGSSLMQLRDSTLDYEFARLVGELQATQEQLRRVRAERVSGDAASGVNLPSGGRLAAEQELLEKQLAGLQQQQKLLQTQQNELRLCSPIAGRVLSWNADNRWQSRPVRQGDRLVEIADVAGDWLLELDVADGDIRHVIDAQSDSGDSNVSFLLATDMQTTYRGRIERIAATAEHGEAERRVVKVTVRVAVDNPAALKAGASVLARIDCGRRSVAYVWLHDAIDALRKFLWM